MLVLFNSLLALLCIQFICLFGSIFNAYLLPFASIRLQGYIFINFL